MYTKSIGIPLTFPPPAPLPPNTHTHTHNPHTALNVTIPSFSGRSYITYQPLNLTTITVTLNPSAPNGLILFTSKSDSDFGDYLSIALVNYYIQFQYNLGSGAAIISSAQALQMNTWYTITVQLSGLNGTLYIDNLDPVFGQSTGPFTTLNVRSSLWLGGYMNFVNVSSITGTNQGFTGCVSSLSIDNMDIDLILDAESGYGVGMCNSSSCQGNPCFNGGSCLDAGSSFVCECVGGFTGPLCGSMVNPCTSDSCPVGSTCQPNINGLNFTCLCPLGRAGDNCQQGEGEQCLDVVGLSSSVRTIQLILVRAQLKPNIRTPKVTRYQQ